MGRYFKLIQAVRVPAATTMIQLNEQAIDVEGFDKIEGSVTVQCDPALPPTITFYSALRNDVDDLAAIVSNPNLKGQWAQVGQIAAAAPGRNTVILQTSNATGVLGKWLRWVIADNPSSQQGCMVDADAIGRRCCP